MLKKSKIYSGLKRVAKNIRDENILDIFVFGSFVKGKIRPKDVDICIVFLKKIDNSKVDEFYSKCSELGFNVHVSPLIAENFFSETHSLVTTIIYEGISLLDGKSMAKRYGLESWTLYSYDISDMKPSEKVKFVFTMKGRERGKGLVNGYGGFFISPGCFLIPINKDSEIKEVLDHWKVKYTRKSILLRS